MTQHDACHNNKAKRRRFWFLLSLVTATTVTLVVYCVVSPQQLALLLKSTNVSQTTRINDNNASSHHRRLVQRLEGDESLRDVEAELVELERLLSKAKNEREKQDILKAKKKVELQKVQLEQIAKGEGIVVNRAGQLAILDKYGNPIDDADENKADENKVALPAGEKAKLVDDSKKTTTDEGEEIAKQRYTKRQEKPPPPATKKQVTSKQEKERKKTTNKKQQQQDLIVYKEAQDLLLHPPMNNMTAIPIQPRVEYLGVLLDAGRHYFPIEWIYNMIDLLSYMGYNLVHFRLTDDQAFNVQLESHPELATPAPGSKVVYSVAELRQVVAHAKKRGIVILPEINIPGHAASWAGNGSHPYILPPCPQFICQKGYGVPLNVTYQPLMGIIKDVIQETMDIFETAPFLHLGGDEVHMSEPCFQEVATAQHKPFVKPDYDAFETNLKRVLQELNITQDGVIRWEMTAAIAIHDKQQAAKAIEAQNALQRAGDLVHWWHSMSYQEAGAGDGGLAQVLVSTGLYMDTNGDEAGDVIFKQARHLATHKWKPRGIVVGTFELSVKWWHDRGIIGRLLAVAMGASAPDDEPELDATRFLDYCQNYLQQDKDLCALVGRPPIPHKTYWKEWNTEFRGVTQRQVCNRLAESKQVPQMIGRYPAQRTILGDSQVNFWNHFGDDAPMFPEKVTKDTAMASVVEKHTVANTGVILDLTRDWESAKGVSRVDRFKETIDLLQMMGFNMIQLRVLSDYAFPLDLGNTHRRLGAQDPTGRLNLMPLEKLRHVVEYAQDCGIQIMPEISVSSQAGGWNNAGFNVQCPNHICETGDDLSIDVNDPGFLAVVSSVLFQLQGIFSSPYLHLGFPPNRQDKGCFDEANIVPDFDLFETKLEAMMGLHGIPLDKVVRWESKDAKDTGKRAGHVTHSFGKLPTADTGPHFVTTGLFLEDGGSKLKDAWGVYQHTVSLTKTSPEAVLAWIGPVTDLTMKPLLVAERLLAVAIALANQDLDQSSFQTLYKEKCAAIGDWMECDLEGKIPQDRIDESEKRAGKEQEALKRAVCKQRTRHYSVVVARKGVLVPK